MGDCLSAGDCHFNALTWNVVEQATAKICRMCEKVVRRLRMAFVHDPTAKLGEEKNVGSRNTKQLSKLDQLHLVMHTDRQHTQE